jgi:2-polyprenyl-3-methyl-5-hydroxy-6-metoxy-1,4-benzoquinol methylase
MQLWKLRMVQKMNALDGVTEHGRVSHGDLAKAMLGIQVWAYPTEFTETHCITALKTQEAGCIPVVTEVAALKETVQSGYTIGYEDIYTNEHAQKVFIEAVVFALKDGSNAPALNKGEVQNRYWSDVAKVWSNHMTDLADNFWTDDKAPKMYEFDINEYDKFYEHHYFDPMNDEDARNADKRLARCKWAVDVAKKIKPKTILDLGCLEGFTQFTIQDKLDYKVTGVGIDLSHEAIELAKARNAKFGMDFEFYQGRIEDWMEQTDQKFDMITCFEVMEHVEDPEKVLKLMDKVLAQGGQILISTPDFESPLFGKDDEDNKCHIRLYTTADEDYEAENKYGHVRKATSLSKQVGKDRIVEMESVAELINCRIK